MKMSGYLREVSDATRPVHVRGCQLVFSGGNLGIPKQKDESPVAY